MVSKQIAGEQNGSILARGLRGYAGIEKKLKQASTAHSVVLVGLAFAAIFWVFEAVVDVVLFNKGTLLDQLIAPDLYQIWMRVLVICTLVMFGVYTRSVLFERKRAIDQLAKIVVHDNLTGLPNRVLFNKKLQAGMEQSRENGKHLAVMMLDLDRFKNVNDTFGHDTGDGLLRGVGERLRSVLRKCDMVARVGGDEFIIVLSGLERGELAADLAERLRRSLARPFEIEEYTISVSASIGIALYPEHGQSVESLVKCADIAMYEAKECGRDCFCIYSNNAGKNAEKLTARAKESYQFSKP